MFQSKLGGGFKHVLFLPPPGEMIQFDEYIFKKGWNHQLVKVYHHPKGVSWKFFFHGAWLPRFMHILGPWTSKYHILVFVYDYVLRIRSPGKSPSNQPPFGEYFWILFQPPEQGNLIIYLGIVVELIGFLDEVVVHRSVECLGKVMIPFEDQDPPMTSDFYWSVYRGP